MKNNKNGFQECIKVILSLPRCGTHFLWSRYIHSGYYQLIFDADRIPALFTLADECKEPLNFLYPPPINPNYNFQYNSLCDINRSLTAAEHLESLSAKYSSSSGFELFKKIMSLQNHNNKYLLSVNRFIYTSAYDFLFKNFTWTIEHASKSLRLLHNWLLLSGYHVSYAMIIREVPQWVNSQLLMYGTKRKNMIIKRLCDTPIILKTCQDLNIPIFWMKDVINLLKKGEMDFENYVRPLSNDVIRDTCDEMQRYISSINDINGSYSAKKFRMGRFIQYIFQRDPIKRTSLVRSIGTFHFMLPKHFPIFSKRIRDDFEGIILNNAKIKI